MVIGWRAEQRAKLGAVQAWAQAESGPLAAREGVRGRANRLRPLGGLQAELRSDWVLRAWGSVSRLLDPLIW